MAKKHITLMEYYENNFDVPLKGRDDELLGDNSIHILQPAFVPVDISDLVKVEEVILSRGAVRGKDYIITCHYEERNLAMLTIHTTNKFLSNEDYVVDADGDIDVKS